MKYEPPKFAPLTPDELARERERSAARRRDALDRFKRTVTPEERSLDWKTKGGFRRKNRKQRGER